MNSADMVADGIGASETQHGCLGTHAWYERTGLGERAGLSEVERSVALSRKWNFWNEQCFSDG